MKYWISTRERWPDYELNWKERNYYEGYIELTDEEWKDWQATRDRFNDWQARIYDAQGKSYKCGD